MTITELRASLGQQLTGDSSFDGTPLAYSQLTPDQQITLTNRMKAYIRDHSADFGTVQNQIAATPDIPLTEANNLGADVTVFADEFQNQLMRAGEDVAAIGNGVLNTAKLGSWLIPGVALAVVGILLYGYYLQQTRK